MKNFLFFIVAVVLSYFTSSYIGPWYNQIEPQHGTFITSANDAIMFAGWLMSFGFFVPFIFGLFGFKKNKNWIIISLVIPMLLWLSSDLYHVYIPVVICLAGFFLAWLLRKIFVRHSNPPMIINKN